MDVDIAEGSVIAKVPDFETVRSSNPVFFNPVMRTNRDVSVALASLLPQGTRILCGMAGSGIRALRYISESGKDVVANDISPLAVENIKSNAALNGLDIETMNVDFNLISRKFDVVDIDPFGSPVRYINPAMRMMKKTGYLFVTATDTAALCGSSYRACVRKYGAYPLNTTYCHETGLRILIGYLAREAASWNYSVSPLACYFTDHYMRVHLRLEKGKRKADDTLRNVGVLHHCPKCKERMFAHHPAETCACGERFIRSYPVWGGNLHEKDMLERMIGISCGPSLSKKSLRLLELMSGEVEVPYNFDSHEVSRLASIQVPPLEKMLETLAGCGISCSKTHFSPMSFKADAGLYDVIACLRRAFPCQ